MGFFKSVIYMYVLNEIEKFIIIWLVKYEEYYLYDGKIFSVFIG